MTVRAVRLAVHSLHDLRVRIEELDRLARLGVDHPRVLSRLAELRAQHDVAAAYYEERVSELNARADERLQSLVRALKEGSVDTREAVRRAFATGWNYRGEVAK